MEKSGLSFSQCQRTTAESRRSNHYLGGSFAQIRRTTAQTAVLKTLSFFRQFHSVWAPKIRKSHGNLQMPRFFGPKGRLWTQRKLKRTKIEHSLELKDSWRSSIFWVSFSLYLFIYSLYLILYLSWTLEIDILSIWLWEANSLFLGEIDRTRCWFFFITNNKFMQYSVHMFVFLLLYFIFCCNWEIE